MTMILLSLMLLLPAAAEDDEISGGPYCGIYCVFSASQMLGQPIEFQQLIELKYVSTFKGSTTSELETALTDHGLVGRPLEGLTLAALQHSDTPIILHVRRPGYKMAYAHWVLYCGDEGGQARIMDPPGGIQLLDYAELASLWDGVGIVVSKPGASAGMIYTASWLESVVHLALAFVMLAICRAFFGLRPRNAFLTAGLLLVIGAILGVGYHSLSSAGILRNRQAVGNVSQQHFRTDIPELNLEETRSRMA